MGAELLAGLVVLGVSPRRANGVKVRKINKCVVVRSVFTSLLELHDSLCLCEFELLTKMRTRRPYGYTTGLNSFLVRELIYCVRMSRYNCNRIQRDTTATGYKVTRYKCYRNEIQLQPDTRIQVPNPPPIQ